MVCDASRLMTESAGNPVRLTIRQIEPKLPINREVC